MRILSVFVAISIGIAAQVPRAEAAGNQTQPVELGGKAGMRARCLASVKESGLAPDPKALKETAFEIPTPNYMFEFKQADGSFFCQVCDTVEAPADCPDLGLRLSFRPATGEARDLPAELDRKCMYVLQKEAQPRNAGPPVIFRSIVERIQIRPAHTDARYVYLMDLDGGEYRCVIRKSDGEYKVDRHQGEEWRPIAAGRMF